MTFPRLLIAAVALIAAAALQMTLASAAAIGPARPDFIVTTLICIAALTGMLPGAAAGLWGGLLMASLMGVDYGSFLVSRALTGVCCGWLSERVLLGEAAMPPVAALLGTFLCEGIYYLMAPTHQGLRWIERIALEAVYNAILSIPIALALRAVGIRREKTSPFR